MTRLRLEIPAASASGVMKALGQLGVRVGGRFSTPDVATMAGILETDFAGYEPVAGSPRERRHRTDA